MWFPPASCRLLAEHLSRSDTREYVAEDKDGHEHREELEKLTEALIEREVLSVKEIEDLIGKRAGGILAEDRDEVVASLDNPIAGTIDT